MKKKNTKGMETLYYSSTINMGIYAGETLYSCLSYYGRKVILELLKYYDIDDNILKAYHYRRLSAKSEDEIEYEMTSPECVVTSSTMAYEDEPFDYSEQVSCDDALNTSDIVELDDTSWATTMVDCKDNVLFDSEDDSMDSCYSHPAVASGWAMPNGRINMWNYDMVTF